MPVVDIRARALRTDNRSYTGADEGRVLDDSVTVLGDKEWAIKALVYSTRSNGENYWRAKESKSYNSAVTSLELMAQSVLKLAELYKQIRVERVEETQQAANTQQILPLQTMLDFMAVLRAHFEEFVCPETTSHVKSKGVKSRDQGVEE